MLSTWGGPKILLYNLDQGSKYYVTDLTVTSGSESEPEEENDKVQVYLVHVPLPYHFPHSLLWVCRLGTGLWQFPHCWSYESPFTSGALSHTLLPHFLALLVNCTLSRVDLSLIGNYYQSTGLACHVCTPVSISSFLFLILGQPLSSVMFLYWLWVYPKYTSNFAHGVSAPLSTSSWTL